MSGFEAPKRECDLVMKGGITSGVVYPAAVLRLAREFRFRCVGGTSAGAIAAAVTAAAEFGRETGGFDKLDAVRKQLRNGSFVFGLFQPTPVAATAFATAVDALERSAQPVSRSKVSALWWWMKLPARHVPRDARRGSMAGILVAIATLALLSGPFLALWMTERAPPPTSVSADLLMGVAAAVTVIVVTVGAVLGATLGGWSAVVRSALRGVEGDAGMFGLCSGSRGVSPSHDVGSPVLTDWLADRIDDLAGRSVHGAPLTVAELQNKQAPDGRPCGITFRMVTTNLSHAQPYLLPMDESAYVFHEDDFRRLFPKRIVDYLIAWSAANPFRKVRLPAGFHRMPMQGALPVVVAVRMSLSFPVLLAAVRLYTVSRHGFAKANEPDAGAAAQLTIEDLEANWFSDGGIGSNFPIHLFDAWMPERPTFGITLRGTLPRATGAKTPARPFLPNPKRFDDVRPVVSPIPTLRQFLLAIFDTAQNFRDNSQTMMPSYRERIVQVPLENAEGGLNLKMPDAVIERIEEKGEVAAELLVRDFDFNQHRWVRSLVLLGHIEDELSTLRRGLRSMSGNNSALSAYRSLLDAQLEVRSKSTRWYRPKSRQWCREAERRVERLLAFADEWAAMQAQWAKGADGTEHFFANDPPHPRGRLRVMPPQ